MIKIFFGTLFLITSIAYASECPMHESHQKGGINERGDKVMGFSHGKTAHHFLLSKDGGVIQVQANDAKESESRDAIRAHLSHIALLFSQGNFEAPMMIHDRVPPGVPVMKELNGAISYKYESMERGGRIVLATDNSDAVKAIHEFLRFQISDHKTGDPMEL